MCGDFIFVWGGGVNNSYVFLKNSWKINLRNYQVE